jgi:lipocalin
METITVQFKAKRRESFHGGFEYSVPDIAPHHVLTPIAKRGTRARLWLSCSDPDIRKARRVSALKLAGMDGYAVHENDATLSTVTIAPQGSGFMAVVTIELSV